jgi:glutaredoxin
MSYLKRSRQRKLSRLWLPLLGSIILAIFIGSVFYAKTYATEQRNTVNIYLFWGVGCPHCADAKEVLEPYIDSQININYKTFEVYRNKTNQKKMQSVSNTLNIDASGVPLIIVGDKSYIGFSSTTGDEIKDRLEYCSLNACPDSVAEIVGTTKPDAQDISKAGRNETSKELKNPVTDSDAGLNSDKIIDLPLIGKVNAASISLPILTIIIGLLDGFNPCAMWALLFIITLLIGMHDRKKMWLYGTVFIATSAIVYFIFMATWLNLFMFIGHVEWVRTTIGLFAIAVGIYYLYDWYQNRTGCKVTGGQKRQKLFARLRGVIKQQNLWLGLGGIILLAAAVNIVELACSAGLPVLYTGILSAAGLATWQYYAYMLLYILFFMIDDLIIFFIAMTTLKVVGIESKYFRITRLIGGVAMCILGLLLILAPQILMFG